MVSVSKYLKDTEDTAPHVSGSVSFKSIFPNPVNYQYTDLIEIPSEIVQKYLFSTYFRGPSFSKLDDTHQNTGQSQTGGECATIRALGSASVSCRLFPPDKCCISGNVVARL